VRNSIVKSLQSTKDRRNMKTIFAIRVFQQGVYKYYAVYTKAR